MQKIIHLKTTHREALYDITDMVRSALQESQVSEGLINIYARGATAAIMIQENWDQSVQNDVIKLLQKIIPQGIWEHDAQDNNGDSHLKAGLIGPQETVPVINGVLGLSRWQNIFFCEFDGPRNDREIVLTIISSQP